MADRGPTTLRSPRSRAIDIGTDPAGFSAELPYNPQAGHPTGTDYPGTAGTYQEPAPHVTGGGTAPVNQPDPFKLGGA